MWWYKYLKLTCVYEQYVTENYSAYWLLNFPMFSDLQTNFLYQLPPHPHEFRNLLTYLHAFIDPKQISLHRTPLQLQY